MEAIIAAVFFDGGYPETAKCIEHIFADELEKATPNDSSDFKTMLQEILQARKLAAPTYALLKTEGMPHSRTFVVEANWEGGRSVGTGKSIKSAEMMAAAEALTALRENETAAAQK